MSNTVLRKWGNSQGAIIPKELCLAAGITPGDQLNISWDPTQEAIVITPQTYSPRRTKHLTIEQIFADWETPSTEISEPDWGDDVGAEVVQ